MSDAQMTNEALVVGLLKTAVGPDRLWSNASNKMLREAARRLRDLPAAGDGEPVAWRVRRLGNVAWTLTNMPHTYCDQSYEIEPLYAAPSPQPAQDAESGDRLTGWEEAIIALKCIYIQWAADARTRAQDDAYCKAGEELVEAMVDSGPTEWLGQRLKDAGDTVKAETRAERAEADLAKARDDAVAERKRCSDRTREMMTRVEKGSGSYNNFEVLAEWIDHPEENR